MDSNLNLTQLAQLVYVICRIAHLLTELQRLEARQILNPSTSAKPVMTKLQTLLIEIGNTVFFPMTLKLSLFTVDKQV